MTKSAKPNHHVVNALDASNVASPIPTWWRHTHPFQINAQILSGTSSNKQESIFTLFHPDMSVEEQINFCGAYGPSGTLEVWCLYPAIEYFLLHAPELLLAALFIKGPLMMSMFLLVVCPAVKAELGCDGWNDVAIYEVSIKTLWSLILHDANVAAMYACDKSSMFRGTFNHNTDKPTVKRENRPLCCDLDVYSLTSGAGGTRGGKNLRPAGVLR